MSLRDLEKRARGYTRDRGDDIYSQIDSALDYLSDLTGGVGKSGRKQLKRAGSMASDVADDTEDLVRANLAASLMVAVGLGVLIGLLFRR